MNSTLRQVLVVAGLSALLSGCCSIAPRAEKFFDRYRPSETVRMFRYAVEAGQWDAAYACLTAEMREQYSQLELSLAIRYGSQNDRNLRDLIERALQLPASHPIPGADPETVRSVTVVFFSDPPEKNPATDTWEQALYLSKDHDSGEWWIDLQKDPGMMQNFTPQ